MRITRVKRSKNMLRLGGIILAVLNKLNGNDGSEPVRDHFNRIMREVKSFCSEPLAACRFDPETYSLAHLMADYKELEKIVLDIDTIDDVDKEIANRILRILEPAYASSEPTK